MLTPAEIQKRVSNVSQKMRGLFRILRREYETPSLLDFGSGAGYFCKAAQNCGFDVYGVELSATLSEFCKKRLGFAQIFHDIEECGTAFDAIFMSDVIEHFDPMFSRSLMSSIVDHLKPGGLLIGNTPNFGSANIRLCKDRDPVIAPPSHLCYFSLSTLEKYLSSFGLSRVSLHSDGLSSNSFLRKSKFSPSFLERGLRSTGVTMLPFYIFLRIAFAVVGACLRPFGLGYQIYFIYRKTR
jgi:SAM-dependent methyltransferase